MICIQDSKLPYYKNARLKASRLWPGLQVYVHGYVSMHGERKRLSSWKTFAKQNNFNTCFSAEEGDKFGEQKKLERVWNCAKYLHVKKLAAGFFRDIKRNTNCITIATVCLILSLPLLYLTLVLNIQILIWPLYKQAWNDGHNSCLSYSIEIHMEYLLGLKLKALNRS